MRSNLTRYESNDGTEFYIDKATGEAFTTQAGYARMSNISKQAVSKRTVNKLELENAEITTTTGVKTVNLIPADVAHEWLKKDRPELAKQMEKAG